MMTRYYIADTHFGHEKAIKMNNRPFATIEEHDETIIENWNKCVTDEDEVYIVGDFIHRSKHSPEYYLEKLHGKKHLIRGNHEKWTKKIEVAKYFESDSQLLELTDDNRHIILCHFPMAEWPRYYKGSLHIFGHIHNDREGDAFRYYQQQPNMLNAGVDINHFRPVSLEELITNNKLFGEVK